MRPPRGRRPWHESACSAGSDHIANLALGCEKRGLSLRLAATYRSGYFDELDDLEDPAVDRYVDKHLQLDFEGQYRFLRN